MPCSSPNSICTHQHYFIQDKNVIIETHPDQTMLACFISNTLNFLVIEKYLVLLYTFFWVDLPVGSWFVCQISTLSDNFSCAVVLIVRLGYVVDLNSVKQVGYFGRKTNLKNSL